MVGIDVRRAGVSRCGIDLRDDQPKYCNRTSAKKAP
jgi:hypothetical protein